MRLVCFIASILTVLTSANNRFEVCFKGLDVVQVQDMTSSFDYLWDNMADQVPEVLAKIESTHPNAYFGFATFGDKPIVPLGFSSDYSLRVDIELDLPHVEETQALFHNYYINAAGGGGDWPEGVVEALFRAMMAPALKWRTPTDRNLEERYARVVVVVTDAMSHDPGDVELLAHQTLPPFDVTVADMLEHGENYKSAEVEYPDIVNVAAFADMNNFSVVFVCAPAGIVYPDGSFIAYAPLARKGERYRNIDGLSLWFKDEFERAGIENVYVEMVDQNMGGYAHAFDSALEQFLDNECPLFTTASPTHSPSSSSDGTAPECIEPTAPECIEPTTPECIEPTVPECTEDATLPECTEPSKRKKGGGNRQDGGPNINIEINVSQHP